MNLKIVAPPISLTESAVIEIKKLIDDSAINSHLALRIGVKSGGCSGFSYIIGFDDKKDNDESFIINGLEVVVQTSHLEYLSGIQVDYQNGLNNRGFIFQNPNATETCGCGSSFNA